MTLKTTNLFINIPIDELVGRYGENNFQRIVYGDYVVYEWFVIGEEPPFGLMTDLSIEKHNSWTEFLLDSAFIDDMPERYTLHEIAGYIIAADINLDFLHSANAISGHNLFSLEELKEIIRFKKRSKASKISQISQSLTQIDETTYNSEEPKIA